LYYLNASPYSSETQPTNKNSIHGKTDSNGVLEYVTVPSLSCPLLSECQHFKPPLITRVQE
jgi:hypothetical protein